MYNHLEDDFTSSTVQNIKLIPLNQLLGGSTIDLLPELTDIFFTNTRQLIVEIAQSFQRNDLAQLHQAAKKMKKLCRQMKFNELTCWAQRLENAGLMNDLETAVISWQYFQIEYQTIKTILQEHL